MQDRPTALELLAAVRAFLEEDVVKALDGRRRFHALVAANVLGIVERELTGEEERLAAEWDRLAALPGMVAGDRPVGTSALRAGVRTLTEQLAEHIRAGEADVEPIASAARNVVRRSVTEKLMIANPRHLGTPRPAGD